jgi:hypothetical protein
MDGTSKWPNRVGLNLAKHTMVICSMTGAVGWKDLVGYVQTSQSIRGVWHYSVAVNSGTNFRSKWFLVDNMNPSELTPMGMTKAVPGLMLDSTALVASVDFRYRPPEALSVASSYRVSRKNAPVRYGQDGGDFSSLGSSLHPVADLKLSSETNTINLSEFAVAQSEKPAEAAAIGKGTSQMPSRNVILPISVQQPSELRRNQPVKEAVQEETLPTKEAQKPASLVYKPIRTQNYKICGHGRRETACVLCKGGSICAHGKQRYWCKQCGGKAWCEHGKQKSRCVQCGGNGVCIHSKLRTRCGDCMNAMPSK